MKEFLSRQSIPFKEVDVSRDPTAAAEMVRISGQQGVPVTVVDGQVVVGYDQPALERLLAGGRHPHLGAAIADVRGVYVGKVTSGGAAAQAGLQVGDVIIRIGDQAVSSAGDLERTLARIAVGQAVSFVYLRGGREYRTTVQF